VTGAGGLVSRQKGSEGPACYHARMFSRRVRWSAPENRFTAALRARRASGAEILDLTVSNPTQVGLPWPHEALAAAMGRAARARYDPDPRGLPPARTSVAAHLSTHDDEVDPDDILITASTSEAYSFLFKLLTDPGDSVVIARPGYPLLEHLAAMEIVELRPTGGGISTMSRSTLL
jgi:alanine-synthesizing transaminase